MLHIPHCRITTHTTVCVWDTSLGMNSIYCSSAPIVVASMETIFGRVSSHQKCKDYKKKFSTFSDQARMNKVQNSCTLKYAFQGTLTSFQTYACPLLNLYQLSGSTHYRSVGRHNVLLYMYMYIHRDHRYVHVHMKNSFHSY